MAAASSRSTPPSASTAAASRQSPVCKPREASFPMPKTPNTKSHVEQHPHPSPSREGSGKAVPVGGYVLASAPIQINVGRPRLKLKVRNTGDRPIQVGSHYHFFEVNRALEFDRA